MADALRHSDWTDDEIDQIVAAYFEIWLGQVLRDGRTKKSRYRELSSRLPGRTEKSVEQKLQNISAVFNERRRDWLPGLTPRSNLQGALRPAVDAYLARNGEVMALIDAHAANVVPGRTLADVATEDVLVSPPLPRQTRTDPILEATVRSGALRDFHMREVGMSGERWVLDRERNSLMRAGMPKLARQVRWVSKEVGDGLGYDIESYRLDGAARLIEVKTTNKGKPTPFFVTRHEVDVSRDRSDQYSLYRVFDFGSRPRLYRLDGSIEESARLEPSVFVGVPR